MASPGHPYSSGPPSHHLASQLRDRIAGVRSQDKLAPVTVVTPSIYASYYLRRALAPTGLFNVEFTRIDDLADRLALPEMGARLPLDRLVASQLVHEAGKGLSPDGLLGAARDHPSFHRSLHRSLTELQLLGPDWLGALERLQGHMRELAQVAAEYRRLATGYYDRSEVGHVAAHVAHTRPGALDPCGTLFVIDTGTAPAQYRPFHEALLSHPRASRVTPPADVSPAAGTAPLPAPGSGMVISAPDAGAEVRWVIRNIIRLVSNNRTRLGDIAVLYADRSYGLRFVEALDRAGIPASGPPASPLSETVPGRFILGLLELSRELSRDSVTTWLTSVPVRDPANGRRTPGHRWDLISRKAGVTRGADKWNSALEGLVRRGRREVVRLRSDDDAELTARGLESEIEIASRLKDFISALASAAAARPEGWQDQANWLARLMHDYLMPPEANGPEIDRAAVRAALDRVGNLSDLGFGVPGHERFDQVITDELARPRPAPQALGRGVFVAPISAAPAAEFAAVHIVGMADGAFMTQDVPDPFLPDAVRSALDPAGTRLPVSAQRRDAQQRLFAASLAAAPQRFILWPRGGPGSAREAYPHPWAVEFANALDQGHRTLHAGDLASSLSRPWFTWLGPGALPGAPDDSADLNEYTVAHMAAWAGAGRQLSQHPAVNLAAATVERAVRLESSRFDSPAWTEYDGNLASRQAAFGRGGAAVASATSWQRWAECPFKHFLADVLEVDPMELPEEQLQISPLDRGLLVHGILQSFADRRAAGPAEPLAGQLRLLADVCDRQFSDAEATSPLGEPAIWAIEKRRIRRLLGEWLREDIALQQRLGTASTRTEVRFGFDGGGAGPVRLILPDNTSVAFRGVMDRIDVTSDGRTAYVFDYKTGSADGYRDIGKDPTLRGQRLQLPIYALAASDMASGGLEAVRAAFWFVLDKREAQFAPRPETFDLAAAVESARRAVATVNDGVSAGRFPARPGHPSQPASGMAYENCRYCDFDRICPTSRAHLWRAKSGAPELASYVELAEGRAEENGREAEDD